MTTASWPTLGIPPAAAPAWHRLSAALTDAEPPCAAEPALWFSTSTDDIETARHRCLACHAIARCDEYATVANERAGVWAGVNRDRAAKQSAPSGSFGGGTPTTPAISDHLPPSKTTNERSHCDRSA